MKLLLNEENELHTGHGIEVESLWIHPKANDESIKANIENAKSER